MQLYYTYSTNI